MVNEITVHYSPVSCCINWNMKSMKRGSKQSTIWAAWEIFVYFTLCIFFCLFYTFYIWLWMYEKVWFREMSGVLFKDLGLGGLTNEWKVIKGKILNKSCIFVAIRPLNTITQLEFTYSTQALKLFTERKLAFQFRSAKPGSYLLCKQREVWSVKPE